MTEEEKQLLLKDLCERLPYGVVLNVDNGKYREDKKIWPGLFNSDNLWDSKPYLRPMSSMTEKEKRELQSFFPGSFGNQWLDIEEGTIDIFECSSTMTLGLNNSERAINFFNSHYIDYRGLIEEGLALEAPEGMYKIEQL